MRRVILYFVLSVFSTPALAELEVISLQHRSAQDVLPIVRPLLDEGGVASGMNNQLILRTSPRNLAEIKKLLESIDTAPRRLLISVMQDVDSETVQRFVGVSGSVGVGNGARLSAGGGRVPGGGLEIEVEQGVDRVRGNIVSTRALEKDHKIQQIQVLEGGRAMISSGVSVPLGHPLGGKEYRNVSGGFYVLPRLNGERVTLEIGTQNDVLARDGNTFIGVQQAATTVSGRLGEWLMVGDIARQTTGNDSTISTRSSSNSQEQRNVLLKVEELR